MDICHHKDAELEPQIQKYKGRVEPDECFFFDIDPLFARVGSISVETSDFLSIISGFHCVLHHPVHKVNASQTSIVVEARFSLF